MPTNSYHASLAGGGSSPNMVDLPRIGGTGPDIPDESGRTTDGSGWAPSNSSSMGAPGGTPLRLAMILVAAGAVVFLIHKAGFRSMVAIGG